MKTCKDLTGEKFGLLLVTEGAGYWCECRCDCGFSASVLRYSLTKRNGTKSCGCLRSVRGKETAVRDVSSLIGQRFDRLIVLGRDGPRWSCRCDCGTVKSVYKQALVKGLTKSCGCLQREMGRERGLARATHGHNRRGAMSPEYRCWAGIVTRCTDVVDPAYEFYGARGVKMHAPWRENFQTFLADVGVKPSPDLTLERIDNDGDYAPGNVRWATRKEQARNRRSSRFIEYNGETLTLAEWAERAGISIQKLWDRLEDGIPMEKALSPNDLRV